MRNRKQWVALTCALVWVAFQSAFMERWPATPGERMTLVVVALIGGSFFVYFLVETVWEFWVYNWHYSENQQMLRGTRKQSKEVREPDR